jgi:hypothetical protein
VACDGGRADNRDPRGGAALPLALDEEPDKRTGIKRAGRGRDHEVTAPMADGELRAEEKPPL